MARADLNAMLGRLGEDDATNAKPPTIEAPAKIRPVNAAPVKRKAATKTDVGPKLDDSVGVAGEALVQTPLPLYRRLERKETRLRADQYAKLTEHARRLSRAKTEGGDRITENTLIRVAIDLLLDRADSLAGSSETELRNSVTP